MYFWIHMGIIIEKQSSSDEKGTTDEFGEYHAPDVSYSIVDDIPQGEDGDAEAQVEEAYENLDEEHESISTKDLFFKGDNYQDGVQIIQKEIINILRVYGPKKLEKIVKNIQAQESELGISVPLGQNDIEELLDTMVKNGLIVYKNYIYYPGMA